MEDKTRTSPVFLAMTRIPTLAGVGYGYFITISIATGVLFINLQSFKVFGFFLIAYVTGYLVCYRNPFQFVEVAQWLQIWGYQRNRKIWKANSYSELS